MGDRDRFWPDHRWLVLSALATLAHDGRRSAFFRKELLLALKIVDGGHIRAADMKGSWAGAMGQNLIHASSFHAFAVDHDGDGRKDIWTNLPDVFASIANYLSGSGWRVDQTWGRAVSLPAGMTRGEIGRKTPIDLGLASTRGTSDRRERSAHP